MARVQAKMCDQPAESRQLLLYNTTIACFTLQLIFVAAKFFTRRFIQGSLMVDDWILAIAMISPLIGSAVMFWCMVQAPMAQESFANLINISHFTGSRNPHVPDLICRYCETHSHLV